MSDAACQGLESKSWDDNLELEWTSWHLDPQRPALHDLDAEQVTLVDKLMLEPESFGTPCFAGASTPPLLRRGFSCCREDNSITVDESSMTRALEPNLSYLDVDVDLLSISDDFNCGAFMGIRSLEIPDFPLQQVGKLGGKRKSGFRCSTEHVLSTFDKGAPDPWDNFQYQTGSPVKTFQV